MKAIRLVERAKSGTLAVTAAGIALALIGAGSAEAQNVWVQIARSSLRSGPEHFAPTVASVSYGDRLTKVSATEDWIKASTASGKTGFIHVSALSGKEVVLSGRRASSNVADAADVVMAGKGFSKEVEAQYKLKGGGMRFDLVDQMERSGNVSSNELEQFVKSGHLKG